MPDDDIHGAIGRLTAEEHALERSHHEGSVTAEDLARLEQLRVQLDQCWDLLRQRRARREFDLDPSAAQVRPPEVVEGYEQ